MLRPPPSGRRATAPSAGVRDASAGFGLRRLDRGRRELQHQPRATCARAAARRPPWATASSAGDPKPVAVPGTRPPARDQLGDRCVQARAAIADLDPHDAEDDTPAHLDLSSPVLDRVRDQVAGRPREPGPVARDDRIGPDQRSCSSTPRVAAAAARPRPSPRAFGGRRQTHHAHEPCRGPARPRDPRAHHRSAQLELDPLSRAASAAPDAPRAPSRG